ncbi:hypothetical protein M569_05873, partial [Genlisea aurea]
EKLLRKEGFRGNNYRLLYGDLKDLVTILEASKSNPIDIDDDIKPRLISFLLKTLKTYGKETFIWLGPTPAIVLLDPELVKEVLTKTDVYGKPGFNSPPHQITSRRSHFL